MYEEARDAYKQAVGINPDSPEAHYALGITYVDLHDMDSAEKELKILQKLNPGLAKKLSHRITK
jgi:tetratricopeptide (TPR) repeat protein